MSKQTKQNMRSIHMASDMLTFNPEKALKIFRLGDVVQFYPQIQIDYYALSLREEPCLQHVIYDIYKFRFRPIAKYAHDLHKNCYHYLIEIFSDFKLFCFNWTKPYKSYLKTGKWYEGHGQLRNCGNAADENENIPPAIMDCIHRTGKLTSIYENLLWHDFGVEDKMKRFKYSKNGYCYKNVLNWYGYSKNLKKFIAKTVSYKKKDIANNSTKELPASSSIIFCVYILN